jgi:hypothetical protein
MTIFHNNEEKENKDIGKLFDIDFEIEKMWNWDHVTWSWENVKLRQYYFK